MITKVRIEGFRSIKLQVFQDIENTLVFVGENNSGKSTFLNAIRVFFDNKLIKLQGNDIHHNNSRCRITIVRKISIDFYKELNDNMKNSNDQTLIDFDKDYKRENPKKSLKTIVYYESFRRYIVGRFFNGRHIQMLGVVMRADKENLNKEYYLTDSTFRRFEEDEIANNNILKTFKIEIASIDDERMFTEEEKGSKNSISNSVFNLFLRNLSKSKITLNNNDIESKEVGDLSVLELNSLLNEKLKLEAQEFLESVNERFEKYPSNDLKINWEFDNELESRVKFKSSFYKGNSTYDFQSTGSGTRSIYLVSLLQAYMNMTSSETNKNALFLIEEPELYLYPKLENEIADILQDISKNNQIFITTHSGNLVQKFPLESVYFTEVHHTRNVFETVFNKLDGITQLIEALGFNSYPFLGKKHLILVEGKTDIKAYERIIKNHHNQYLEETLVLDIGGVENVAVPLTLHFIKDSELINNVLIILDSDGRTRDNSMKRYKKVFTEKLNHIKGMKSKLDGKLYVTEDATMLEALSINCDEVFSNDALISKWKCFLIKYRSSINKTLNDKLREGVITLIEKTYFESLIDIGEKESLSIFKERIADKYLIRKYQDEVQNLSCISNMAEKKTLTKKIPILMNNLDELFSS